MNPGDDELHENIKLLKDYLKKGKIKIAQHLHVIDSLKKVSYAADGKVDSKTVDPLVRSLAKTVSFIEFRSNLKEVPLLKIQEEYFKILDGFFSNPYEQMIKHNITPHIIATEMSKKPSIVGALYSDLNSFEKGLLDFWGTFGDAIAFHIQDLKGLKTIYGGDIFPTYKNNTVETTGLYVDTTILPDPLLRVTSFMKHTTPEKGTYYLIKHALSALRLKKLALANVDPPIVIIAPDPFILNKDVTKIIALLGEQDNIKHLNQAFGKKFQNNLELKRFLSTIKTVTDLENSLKEPEKILFDTDWKNLSFSEQWSKSQDGSLGISLPKSLTLGETLEFSMLGRMMQANELLYKASMLHGVPLIDAPTSWQYFLWKYEYDKTESTEVNPELSNMLVVNALQNEKLSWLGNIPDDALIKLRREGALSEIRSLFSKGIKEIQIADEYTYSETVLEIMSNMNKAFTDHLKLIKDHSNGVKKYFGFDIAPWLVTGAVSIASASTGNVPLSIASAIASMVGFTSGKEIWIKGKKLIEEKNKIIRSPVGLLFEARIK